ncbi:hypothetical protein C5167_021676 [Papaver somniferum]|nr:hypothetical protein C5167_021676 [Papaver somniferum]
MSYTINFPLPTSSSSSPPPSTFTPSSTLLPISTKHLAQLEASEHFQYQPTIWDYKHFVESPKNNYSVIIEFIYICQHLFMSMYANYLFVSVFMYIQCKTDAELLMEKEKQVNLVRVTLKEAEKPLAKLELIDVIQSLGTSYIFEEDIHKILENRHAIGGFKESITNDIKGMLSLFEEAYKIKCMKLDLSKQVRRPLEKPIHWRVQRSEARLFIEAYESQKDMNPLLFELAKLNFNMV